MSFIENVSIKLSLYLKIKKLMIICFVFFFSRKDLHRDSHAIDFIFLPNILPEFLTEKVINYGINENFENTFTKVSAGTNKF